MKLYGGCKNLHGWDVLYWTSNSVWSVIQQNQAYQCVMSSAGLNCGMHRGVIVTHPYHVLSKETDPYRPSDTDNVQKYTLFVKPNQSIETGINQLSLLLLLLF